MNDLHDINKLRRTITIHKHPTIPSYVRLADISQPWRDRFLEALVSSQVPLVEGEGDVVYEADWFLFLDRTERRLRAGRIAEVFNHVKTGPLPAVLEAAPVFDPWFVLWAPGEELSLLGAVSGHPRLLGEGRWIATSMLIGLDLEAGRARTISRWYRLGKLISAAECEVVRGKPLNPAFTPAGIDEVGPWFDRLRAIVARDGFDV